MVGTQGIVTLVLWEKPLPPRIESRLPRCGALLYCVGQIALAALVYLTTDHGRNPNLVWLALLPPSFFFAVLFTLVFTLLAVPSEKARNQVQQLATELELANRQLREYAGQAEELALCPRFF